MRIIKKFENFNKQITLYHGTPNDEPNFNDITSLSTEPSFAMNYGNKLFEITIENVNVLDTNNISDCEKIINKFKFLDEGINGNITNAEELKSDPYNWRAIELTSGVLDWVFSLYDGIWVYEEGVRNLILKTPNNHIVDVELIDL